MQFRVISFAMYGYKWISTFIRIMYMHWKRIIAHCAMNGIPWPAQKQQQQLRRSKNMCKQTIIFFHVCYTFNATCASAASKWYEKKLINTFCDRLLHTQQIDKCRNNETEWSANGHSRPIVSKNTFIRMHVIYVQTLWRNEGYTKRNGPFRSLPFTLNI